MNKSPIRAVIFDMGGTLEDIYYDDALRLEATRGLKRILDEHGLDKCYELEHLYRIVDAGMKQYGVWREESERELPASRIWSEYVLAGQGLRRDQVAEIGEDLALYYDLHVYKRSLRPEARELLNCLRERGVRLGVISNVYSRRAVPINLARYELAHYFDTVVTSAAFGWRKPNPSIFLETARQMQLTPGECVYVGDTVSRDVVGARRAKFGLAIQIKSFLTEKSDTDHDTELPDAVIQDLRQVSDIITRERETDDARN
jgi:putative hydrolase of the HAD superfamily